MAAGVAGLSQVFTPAEAERLNQAGDTFRERLNAVAAQHDTPLQMTGVGSIVCLHFQNDPIEKAADVVTPNDLRALFHLHMLDHGLYLGRRGFMSLSIPLVEADYDRFVAAFEGFTVTYHSILKSLVA